MEAKKSHKHILLKYSNDRRKKKKRINLRNFLSALVQILAVPETVLQDLPQVCSVFSEDQKRKTSRTLSGNPRRARCPRTDLMACSPLQTSSSSWTIGPVWSSHIFPLCSTFRTIPSCQGLPNHVARLGPTLCLALPLIFLEHSSICGVSCLPQMGAQGV